MNNEKQIRAEALKEAARIAMYGYLVPPDGGSASEDERLMCERIAKNILELINGEPDPFAVD